MLELRKFFALAVVCACCIGCGPGTQQPPVRSGSEKPPAAAKGAWAGEAKDIVAAHRGQLLLLLLGREDCPGTARATQILDGYAAKSPAGVAIVRVEVPLPEESLTAPEKWQHAFPYAVDHGRQLAGGLDFFYYPTLYIFDRDGELRFAGDCDVTRLPQMVSEIAAEQPGSPKKSYTLPLPAVGEPAPAFSGRRLDGRTAKLDDLRGKRATLLFFSATSCPFSVKALKPLGDVAKAFNEHGVAAVVINREQEKSEIGPVYEKAAPELPVIWDQTGEICKSYGVSAVPFFFVLDGAGKVVARRSFTAAAATAALNTHLKLAVAAPRYKPKDAG